MAHAYRAVGWNRQKRIYDATLLLGVGLYLAAFLAVSTALRSQATVETLLIRASGTAAFLLLHVILSIGPLCRLDPRFLPLLYNRRHLGVTMFALALVHAGLAVIQFHAFSSMNPLVSVLVSDGRWSSLAHFPFQPFGLAALAVLFLMACTSHDFWLEHLTPAVWKSLHMLVYPAYGLLVLHVALGALQAETSPALTAIAGAGLVWVLGLHCVAGWRELRRDRPLAEAAGEAGWVDTGPAGEIPDGRARVVTIGDERVAIFRYGGLLSAVSNVCRHQNGPLGEGRVLDGCITCPWHGYQYDPATGTSPPPFVEKVPTYRVRLVGDRVLVAVQPLPAGTPVRPARLEAEKGSP